jgi:hypothetical protein
MKIVEKPKSSNTESKFDTTNYRIIYEELGKSLYLQNKNRLKEFVNNPNDDNLLGVGIDGEVYSIDLIDKGKKAKYALKIFQNDEKGSLGLGTYAPDQHVILKHLSDSNYTEKYGFKFHNYLITSEKYALSKIVEGENIEKLKENNFFSSNIMSKIYKIIDNSCSNIRSDLKFDIQFDSLETKYINDFSDMVQDRNIMLDYKSLDILLMPLVNWNEDQQNQIISDQEFIKKICSCCTFIEAGFTVETINENVMESKSIEFIKKGNYLYFNGNVYGSLDYDQKSIKLEPSAYNNYQEIKFFLPKLEKTKQVQTVKVDLFNENFSDKNARIPEWSLDDCVII